jgi:hypothetical protein
MATSASEDFRPLLQTEPADRLDECLHDGLRFNKSSRSANGL